MDERFTNWEEDKPVIAAGLKAGFFARKFRALPWWGEACQTLLHNFLQLLRPIMEAKEDILLDRLSSDQRRERFDALAKEHADVFDTVIQLFDNALLEIVLEDAMFVAMAVSDKTFPPVPAPPNVPRVGDNGSLPASSDGLSIVRPVPQVNTRSQNLKRKIHDSDLGVVEGPKTKRSHLEEV